MPDAAFLTHEEAPAVDAPHRKPRRSWPSSGEVFAALRLSRQEEAYTKAIAYDSKVSVAQIYEIIIALDKTAGHVADGLIFDLVRAVARANGKRGLWDQGQFRTLLDIASSRKDQPTWSREEHLFSRRRMP